MKIALLDDERMALAVLEKNVKKAVPDAEIVGFRMHEDIIEFAERNSFDIAFLDMNMPETNGFLVAEKLRSINPDIRIIFCTGDTECTSKSEYVSIPKPSSAFDVAEAVRNLS